jgi:hypothetical protein
MTRVMLSPESVRVILNTLVTGAGVGVGVGTGVGVSAGVGLAMGVGEGVSFSALQPKMLAVNPITNNRVSKAVDLLIPSNTPKKLPSWFSLLPCSLLLLSFSALAGML